MNIRTAGTWIGLAVSISAGAVIAIFPNQQFVASIVLAASVLLVIISIGWYIIAKWYSTWSITSQIVVILFCGIFIGIYVSGIPYFGFPFRSFLTANEARLYLRFSDDQTSPVQIQNENVAYWYSVWNPSVVVNETDENKKLIGGFSIPPHWDIFIIFDKPTKIGQMIVKCDGPYSPKCNVSTANSVYAVITANGDVTLATMDIYTIK